MPKRANKGGLLNGHAKAAVEVPQINGHTSFEPRMSGYSHYGASRSKSSMAGWIATGGSPEEDITDNAQLLRERSRDAFMGICLARGAIETYVSDVIGYGLYPTPSPDADYLGWSAAKTRVNTDRLGKYFDSWADSPAADYHDRFSFYQLQSLAFQSMLLSGDCPVLLPFDPRPQYQFDLRVRVLEADRIMTPPARHEGAELEKIYGGVEIDDEGRVVAYWIAQRHPLQRRFTSRAPGDHFVRVPVYGGDSGRRNMLFLMRPERPEQRRGVPMLSCVLEPLKQMGRYIEATTVKAVITSYFTAFIKSELPGADMLENLLPQAQRDSILGNVGGGMYDLALGPGIINFLKPGEEVAFSTNTASDPNFHSFIIGLTQQIGSALGIPYEILLKQFNSSYSASRAALLDFNRRVKVSRQLMIDQFAQPVYEEWLSEAVEKGVIDAPGFFENAHVRRSWCRCIWTGASPGSIDPIKEIDAANRRIQTGVSTVERESIEINGSDWRENTVQQGREIDAFIAEGMIYPTYRGMPNVPVTFRQPSGQQPQEDEEDDDE